VIVVADTSVILNLCCVRESDLLPLLFREVLVPPEVAGEFQRLAAEVSRFKGLQLPSWIRQQACSSVPESLRVEGLDPGETAALALALEIGADAVLVDERRGHEVALQLGLIPLGLISILLRAKAGGHLLRVSPILDALRRDAKFWLSDELCKKALRLAGETG
jgi:predicted nucleic acid-binding protein